MQNQKDFNLPYALHLLTEKDAILLDVRTYEEFCQGHLAGARFVATQLPPLDARERKNLKDQMRYLLLNVAKNVPIVVYCKKGVRAKIAKNLLIELGYYNAVALGGVQEPPLDKVFSGENPVWKICYCSG